MPCTSIFTKLLLPSILGFRPTFKQIDPLGFSAFSHDSSVQYYISLSAGPFPLPTFIGFLGTMAQTDFCRFSHTLQYGLHPIRCVPRRPPRLRFNSLHSMQPPHLRDRVRVVWDFDLSCSLVRSAPPYMRFLFVGSELCLRLPSDSVSRRTPLPFG